MNPFSQIYKFYFTNRDKEEFLYTNAYFYRRIPTYNTIKECNSNHINAVNPEKTDIFSGLTILIEIGYLTLSTIALKAAGLFIARSARTLRLISIPALCNAPINCEYDIPSRRAAALIRWIHNARNSRFLLRRSRNAYVRPFSQVFLATVHTFFLAPK